MNTWLVPRCVDGAVIEVAGDELFVFNPADEMMHALNGSSTSVLQACDGERTHAEITALLAVDGLSPEMVQLGLSELQSAGLVSFEVELEAPSRRELLIKLGAGAAAIAAIPVVESIVAPRAVAASSAPSPTPAPAPSPASGSSGSGSTAGSSSSGSGSTAGSGSSSSGSSGSLPGLGSSSGSSDPSSPAGLAPPPTFTG